MAKHVGLGEAVAAVCGEQPSGLAAAFEFCRCQAVERSVCRLPCHCGWREVCASVVCQGPGVGEGYTGPDGPPRQDAGGELAAYLHVAVDQWCELLTDTAVGDIAAAVGEPRLRKPVLCPLSYAVMVRRAMTTYASDGGDAGRGL